MAGNKNSGRKSNYHEMQEGNLEKVCVDWILNNFHSFDKATKLKVALTIAPRTITSKVDVKDTTERSKQEQEELEDIRSRIFDIKSLGGSN